MDQLFEINKQAFTLGADAVKNKRLALTQAVFEGGYFDQQTIANFQKRGKKGTYLINSTDSILVKNIKTVLNLLLAFEKLYPSFFEPIIHLMKADNIFASGKQLVGGTLGVLTNFSDIQEFSNEIWYLSYYLKQLQNTLSELPGYDQSFLPLIAQFNETVAKVIEPACKQMEVLGMVPGTDQEQAKINGAYELLKTLKTGAGSIFHTQDTDYANNPIQVVINRLDSLVLNISEFQKQIKQQTSEKESAQSPGLLYNASVQYTLTKTLNAISNFKAALLKIDQLLNHKVVNVIELLEDIGEALIHLSDTNLNALKHQGAQELNSILKTTIIEIQPLLVEITCYLDAMEGKLGLQDKALSVHLENFSRSYEQIAAAMQIELPKNYPYWIDKLAVREKNLKSTAIKLAELKEIRSKFVNEAITLSTPLHKLLAVKEMTEKIHSPKKYFYDLGLVNQIDELTGMNDLNKDLEMVTQKIVIAKNEQEKLKQSINQAGNDAETIMHHIKFLAECQRLLDEKKSFTEEQNKMLPRKLRITRAEFEETKDKGRLITKIRQELSKERMKYLDILRAGHNKITENSKQITNLATEYNKLITLKNTLQSKINSVTARNEKTGFHYDRKQKIIVSGHHPLQKSMITPLATIQALDAIDESITAVEADHTIMKERVRQAQDELIKENVLRQADTQQVDTKKAIDELKQLLVKVNEIKPYDLNRLSYNQLNELINAFSVLDNPLADDYINLIKGTIEQRKNFENDLNKFIDYNAQLEERVLDVQRKLSKTEQLISNLHGSLGRLNQKETERQRFILSRYEKAIQREQIGEVTINKLAEKLNFTADEIKHLIESKQLSNIIQDKIKEYDDKLQSITRMQSAIQDYETEKANFLTTLNNEQNNQVTIKKEIKKLKMHNASAFIAVDIWQQSSRAAEDAIRQEIIKKIGKMDGEEIRSHQDDRSLHLSSSLQIDAKKSTLINNPEELANHLYQRKTGSVVSFFRATRNQIHSSLTNILDANEIDEFNQSIRIDGFYPIYSHDSCIMKNLKACLNSISALENLVIVTQPHLQNLIYKPGMLTYVSLLQGSMQIKNNMAEVKKHLEELRYNLRELKSILPTQLQTTKLPGFQPLLEMLAPSFHGFKNWLSVPGVEGFLGQNLQTMINDNLRLLQEMAEPATDYIKQQNTPQLEVLLKLHSQLENIINDFWPELKNKDGGYKNTNNPQAKNLILLSQMIKRLRNSLLGSVKMAQGDTFLGATKVLSSVMNIYKKMTEIDVRTLSSIKMLLDDTFTTIYTLAKDLSIQIYVAELESGIRNESMTNQIKPICDELDKIAKAYKPHFAEEYPYISARIAALNSTIAKQDRELSELTAFRNDINFFKNSTSTSRVTLETTPEKNLAELVTFRDKLLSLPPFKDSHILKALEQKIATRSGLDQIVKEIQTLKDKIKQFEYVSEADNFEDKFRTATQRLTLYSNQYEQVIGIEKKIKMKQRLAVNDIMFLKPLLENSGANFILPLISSDKDTIELLIEQVITEKIATIEFCSLFLESKLKLSPANLKKLQSILQLPEGKLSQILDDSSSLVTALTEKMSQIKNKVEYLDSLKERMLTNGPFTQDELKNIEMFLLPLSDDSFYFLLEKNNQVIDVQTIKNSLVAAIDSANSEVNFNKDQLAKQQIQYQNLKEVLMKKEELHKLLHERIANISVEKAKDLAYFSTSGEIVEGQSHPGMPMRIYDDSGILKAVSNQENRIKARQQIVVNALTETLSKENSRLKFKTTIVEKTISNFHKLEFERRKSLEKIAVANGIKKTTYTQPLSYYLGFYFKGGNQDVKTILIEENKLNLINTRVRELKFNTLVHEDLQKLRQLLLDVEKMFGSTGEYQQLLRNAIFEKAGLIDLNKSIEQLSSILINKDNASNDLAKAIKVTDDELSLLENFSISLNKLLVSTKKEEAFHSLEQDLPKISKLINIDINDLSKQICKLKLEAENPHKKKIWHNISDLFFGNTLQRTIENAIYKLQQTNGSRLALQTRLDYRDSLIAYLESPSSNLVLPPANKPNTIDYPKKSPLPVSEKLWEETTNKMLQIIAMKYNSLVVAERNLYPTDSQMSAIENVSECRLVINALLQTHEGKDSKRYHDILGGVNDSKLADALVKEASNKTSTIGRWFRKFISPSLDDLIFYLAKHYQTHPQKVVTHSTVADIALAMGANLETAKNNRSQPQVTVEKPLTPTPSTPKSIPSTTPIEEPTKSKSPGIR